jgi:1-acyl-sn-glycerol-3-phosphate acyltransferase
MEAYGLWRVFWFGIALFSTAFVLVTVCLPLVPYVWLRDPHRRSLFSKISSIWATTLCSMFFRVEVINAENLPDKDDARKYMYVANHQSFMDILSVFSLRRPFKFISKASILWIPVVGFAMRLLGHITVDRKSQQSQVQMIRRCLLELRKGTSVFFFPEGTRTKSGRLRTFTKGAFSIAKKARVGVVPITVLGTGDIMPAGRELRLFPSRLGVRLIVHPTFSEQEVQELAEADLRKLATEVVRSGMPPALRDDHESVAAVSC